MIVKLSLEHVQVIKLQHKLLILTKVTQCFLSIIVNFLACKRSMASNNDKTDCDQKFLMSPTCRALQ